VYWTDQSTQQSPLEALAAACADFGISVDEALLDKARELHVRTYLRALPNDRIKPSQYLDFISACFAPRPAPNWIPTMLEETGRGPSLSESELILLEHRQNGRCTLCGVFLTLASQPHVDHIIPIALRGKSIMANYQLLCASCNLGKSKLLGWIMGAPFLTEGQGQPTSKQRFCVLARADGKCEVDGCDADSSNAELRVVTRIQEAYGGRWIFDNMMSMCRDHVTARDAEILREARRSLRKARR